MRLLGLRRTAHLADGWLASAYNTTPTDSAIAWAAAPGARSPTRARTPAAFRTRWRRCGSTSPTRAHHRGPDRPVNGWHRSSTGPKRVLRERLPVGSRRCLRGQAPRVRAGGRRPTGAHLARHRRGPPTRAVLGQGATPRRRMTGEIDGPVPASWNQRLSSVSGDERQGRRRITGRGVAHQPRPAAVRRRRRDQARPGGLPRRRARPDHPGTRGPTAVGDPRPPRPEAFMQKNVPKYTPAWVRTVQFWAETSKRDVSYALCNDRRTLLWFANQRAVEYHPTLVRADRPDHVTHLVLDLDPPDARRVLDGGRAPPTWSARRSPTSGWRARSRRAARRACTCSSRSRTSVTSRTRPRRPERSRRAPSGSIPTIATTAFMKDDRGGKVFVDSTTGRRRDGDRGVQPARPAGHAGVVPGRLGRSRRRRAGATSPCTRRSRSSATATRGPRRWPTRSVERRPHRGGPRHPGRPGAGHARRQAPRPRPPGLARS